MTTWLYRLFVIAALGLYAVAASQGWEFGDSPREELPASVRQSPGGYRTGIFWYGGVFGGK